MGQGLPGDAGTHGAARLLAGTPSACDTSCVHHATAWGADPAARAGCTAWNPDSVYSDCGLAHCYAVAGHLQRRSTQYASSPCQVCTAAACCATCMSIVAVLAVLRDDLQGAAACMPSGCPVCVAVSADTDTADRHSIHHHHRARASAATPFCQAQLPRHHMGGIIMRTTGVAHHEIAASPHHPADRLNPPCMRIYVFARGLSEGMRVATAIADSCCARAGGAGCI